MIRRYLEHLERDCNNTSRTRNLRLTAIRSFMKYLEYEVPSALDQIRQILAISNKRTEERLVNHLTPEEMKAVLDAPDPGTRTGIRDQAMLCLGFAAGLRASELVGLRLDDIELDGPYPSILVRRPVRSPSPAAGGHRCRGQRRGRCLLEPAGTGFSQPPMRRDQPVQPVQPMQRRISSRSCC
jgi:integrase